MTENRPIRWSGPAPIRPDASMTTRRLIDLANRIPAAQWVSDDDLAMAYSVRYAKPMTVRKLASALLPERHAPVDEWALPCHRLRLADGRAISRKYGILGSDDEQNRMFEGEGGDLRDGVATAACRFDLVSAVRAEINRS